MITLYYSPQTRSARIFWMLEEIGQPYELEAVDIRGDRSADSAEFRAASPLAKVPAIMDRTDGSTARVADSAAICLYLADRYAPGELAPAADDPARGEFLTWLFYTPSVIEPAMAEKIAGIEPNPTSYAWGSWDRMRRGLSARLDGREWLVGDHFTAADLMISGSLQFMSSFGLMELSPAMAAYRDRCFERPAAIRAQEREQAAS
ncbi:MAG: glutathione S-transferase family protein [Pseudomonadota bacterium]